MIIECRCRMSLDLPEDGEPVVCKNCGETYKRNYLPICEDPVILMTSKYGDRYYTRYEAAI